MQKADPLIHTKLRLPFTRAELVTRLIETHKAAMAELRAQGVW